MATEDPDIWRKAVEWMWGILALPIAFVWKRVNGAVQKEDFKEYADQVRAAIKEHAENDEKANERLRDAQIKLFEKLEKQGETLAKIDATVGFLKSKS